MKPGLALISLCLGLAAAPSAWGLQPQEVAPCRTNMPARPRSLPGVFTVHVVCDHVLFEIPPAMLGREMLLSTEFAALSTGTDYAALGSAVDTRVVRWLRRGDQIHVETMRYEIRERDVPELERGAEAAQLGTVIRSFDAVAEGRDGAAIVDMTPMFTTEVPVGFATAFMRHFKMSAVDGKRSYLQSVKAFPRNIDIRFYQTWTADPKELLKADSDDRPRHASLGFVFHTSLLLLPEQPMRPRYWDERVGYFDVEFLDYGTGAHGGVQRAFIQRYRLEKKNPQARISEPKQPIVFYISREVPDVWRPYLKRAVEDWQPLFEKAGFQHAIIARDAPSPSEDPGWDPDDVRYNVIRWTPGDRENALGAAVHDPRSGEVISSHTIFWHDVLKLLETWYFTQVSPLDPRARKLPLPDDLMGELLRYVATHEIGHALGLRHNFKAPAAFTIAQLRSPEWTQKWGDSASIMSYARFNYVAQPGDGAYLLPKFGPYDYFAVEWGYKEIPGARTSDEEWPELDRMAARQIEDPLLRFGGEDYPARFDPAVNTQVLSSDPIAAADLGLRNIDRVADLLIPATTELGKDYSLLAEMYQALVEKRLQELSAVAKLVGGVEEVRYEGGRGEAPFSPVPSARQRAAVRFLLDRAFVKPGALLNPQVLRRIAPTGATDPLQGSNIRLLSQLVDPGAFDRMAEAAMSAPKQDAYAGGDLLADLSDGLFRELDQSQPVIDLYRRRLQRQYLSVLLVSFGTVSDPEQADANIAPWPQARASVELRSQAARDLEQLSSPLAQTARDYRQARGLPSEFGAALRASMKRLVEKIDVASPKVKDPATAAHLQDLHAVLAKAL